MAFSEAQSEFTYPMKDPTNAARNMRPVGPVDQLYGAPVMISEMVLKETIPAVLANA